MANKVTQQDIIKINELYLKYKTYAAVARETGFSATTVKKYIVQNFAAVPTTKFEGSTELKSEIFKEYSWDNLLELSDNEKEEMEILRKEVNL